MAISALITVKENTVKNMFVEGITDIRIERIIPPTKPKIKIYIEYILSSSESKSNHGLLIIEKKIVVHLLNLLSIIKKCNLFFFTDVLFICSYF